MPEIRYLPIKDLKLDLHNFRLPTQSSELASVHTIISVNPEWFWALAESLLENGFEITENILVLESGKKGADKLVKEGNRRIAILKIAYGHIRRSKLDMPEHIEEKIKNLSDEWKASNREVPCAVYGASESAVVDRIVSLTHGKGEKAGRDRWKAVARARHNKIMQGVSEPGLDLLEAYLKHGKNLTDSQKERWGGDYPLTVLDEAMKKLAPRFGATNWRDMADQYPNKIKYKKGLEGLLHDIGLKEIGFEEVRNKDQDVLTKYGVPVIQSAAQNGKATASGKATSNSATTPATTATSSAASTASTGKTKAVALNDQRAVIRLLQNFQPVGKHREKLVTLLKEIRTLKPKTHPHAFCFLLRSLFELSAKAYCRDHKNTTNAPTATKASGEDRHLIDILRDITAHLTKNNSDKPMLKTLHGALAVMATPNSFLSVTSLNQLVHNPTFSLDESHICTLFGNIFPLLEQMNS